MLLSVGVIWDFRVPPPPSLGLGRAQRLYRRRRTVRIVPVFPGGTGTSAGRAGSGGGNVNCPLGLSWRPVRHRPRANWPREREHDGHKVASNRVARAGITAAGEAMRSYALLAFAVSAVILVLRYPTSLFTAEPLWEDGPVFYLGGFDGLATLARTVARLSSPRGADGRARRDDHPAGAGTPADELGHDPSDGRGGQPVDEQNEPSHNFRATFMLGKTPGGELFQDDPSREMSPALDWTIVHLFPSLCPFGQCRRPRRLP